MSSDHLRGGLGDAPIDAARLFRAAMQAMARPGRIETMTGISPPAPLSPAAGAVLLTLADPTTPVFLGASHNVEAVQKWLAFHTGAPLAARSFATFAVGDWPSLSPLSGYRLGTPQYPDRSATLIVELDELTDEDAQLTGPGIKDTATLSVPEPEVWAKNAAQYPLGVDAFFTAGTSLAALPRSTRVHARQEAS